MILALLGDNPMQSEFACHVGLTGKFFCRACWVKGKDANVNNAAAAAAAPPVDHTPEEGAPVAAGSDAGSSVGSDDSAVPEGQPKKKKLAKAALETLGIMVERVTAFIKVNPYST